MLVLKQLLYFSFAALVDFNTFKNTVMLGILTRKRKAHTLLFLIIFIESAPQPPFACDSSNPSTEEYLFCQTFLSTKERVKDLVSRLTLDEKISRLVNTEAAIPLLGIPAYQWWSEALQGVAFLPHVAKTQGIHFNGTITKATSFPQVIHTAASFDTRLWYRIGKYAVSFVRGLQGDSFEGGKLGEQLQASACCKHKHFIAHDLDNWKAVNRFIFNAKVYNIRLRFKSSMMIKDMPNYQKMRVQMCLKQSWQIVGMDVECGNYLKTYTELAVSKKKLQETEIDTALSNLFSVIMRLGLFNGNPTKLPYSKISANQVCSQEHQALALEAARDGTILLKNSDKFLPLWKSKITSLAVIGQCR
ncbi:hypothetical protein RCOM_1034290 [Ricinus communis]|uniref:Uncharacterized protein n=1 Tax=Ricinus communis TaxID=3988 RepID=B9RJH2_RICCO|nr:hypothetical protein RCOM_1034290 [Ricinus communis]